MLKCILIDDEPNAINLLGLLIAEATNWQVAARCYNGLEALQAIKVNQPDLIFLDINMPQLNGLELAALLPKNIKIVFTTAYSEYGAESYLHDALDYILKPITLKRFLATQHKIEAWFSNIDNAPVINSVKPVGKSTQHIGNSIKPLGNSIQPVEYFYVKAGNGLQKILLKEILYIEGDKEYIKLVTAKDSLLVYRRLKQVEEQLKYPFIRVHNSYIANMEKMEKYADNHIIIAGQRIPVSDKYRSQFMAYLNDKLF